MKRALLISLDSDLGKHMKRVLEEEGYEVVATSRHNLPNTINFDLDSARTPKLEPSSFDVLVYNLGVSQVNRTRVDVIRVNAILACDALRAFAPCIKSGGHSIVFSSGWGSIQQTLLSGETNDISYRMSKAALNIGVAILANTFTTLKWVLMQPGFITTKMNTNPKKLPSVDPYEAMKGVLKHSLSCKTRYSFIDYTGKSQ